MTYSWVEYAPWLSFAAMMLAASNGWVYWETTLAFGILLLLSPHKRYR